MVATVFAFCACSGSSGGSTGGASPTPRIPRSGIVLAEECADREMAAVCGEVESLGRVTLEPAGGRRMGPARIEVEDDRVAYVVHRRDATPLDFVAHEYVFVLGFAGRGHGVEWRRAGGTRTEGRRTLRFTGRTELATYVVSIRLRALPAEPRQYRTDVVARLIATPRR